MAFERVKSFLLSNRGQWLLLLAFMLILYFVNLGAEGLYSAQEARAAVVTRNMLQDGNWLTMELPFEPTTEKPMFCYWLYAVSAIACGGIGELAVRLPSALSALISIVLTVWLAGRIYGRTTGFAAGYVLGTMVTFVNLGRTARIDIVLTAFYLTAMVCLYKAYFEQMKKSRWWLYLFYLLLGVTVMVKGPVGVAMAGLMLAAYMVVFRRWRMMIDLEPYTGALIMAAVALPWYWYENHVTQGAFFWDFIVEHNVKRFLGTSEFKEGKFMPLYWYFPKFFAGALPWTIAAPFALWTFCRRFRQLRPQTWWLIFWFVTGFIFFSGSAVKRGDYILPLYPAAAILLARYLVGLDGMKVRLGRWWLVGWGVLVALAAGFLIVVRTGLLARLGAKAAENVVPHLSTRDGRSMMQISELVNAKLWLVILGAAVILTFLFMIGRVLARGRVLQAMAWFLPGLLLVMVIHFAEVQPVLDRYNTVKQFCLECDRVVPKDGRILFLYNINTEIVYYLQRPYDFASSKTLAEAISRADYIIMQGKFYRRDFSKSDYAKIFRPVAGTIPEHNYSNVLVERINRSGRGTPPAPTSH